MTRISVSLPLVMGPVLPMGCDNNNNRLGFNLKQNKTKIHKVLFLEVMHVGDQK